MKKFLKILATVVLSVIVLFLLFLAVLSILEYRPAEVEYLTVENRAEKTQKVEPGKEMVDGYLDGIDSIIDSFDPDMVLLQEVDSSSSRTYRIDEREVLSQLPIT